MLDLRELLNPARLPEWCAVTRKMEPDDAAAALVTLAALEKALSLRVNDVHAPAQVDAPAGSDRFLTAAEAAKRLGQKPRWLRDRRLPFRVQVSPRRVRYSEAGMERWMRRKNALA